MNLVQASPVSTMRPRSRAAHADPFSLASLTAYINTFRLIASPEATASARSSMPMLPEKLELRDPVEVRAAQETRDEL